MTADLEDKMSRPAEVLHVKLMKQGPPNITKFVLGSTGSGKSTLMANLLLKPKRFVIFDSRDEYDPAFYGGQIFVAQSASQLLDLLNNGAERIIYKIPFRDQETGDMDFNAACINIYQFQLANKDIEELSPLTISIDETNRFVESGDWPQGLQEIIQRGRDCKIEKIFGAQWFGQIPTWFRDSFSEIYTFRHNDPAGIDRLELFGFDGNQIQNLPNYTCLHFGKEGITEIKLQATNIKEANGKES